MNNDSKNNYHTSDLGLAAALASKNFTLIGLDKSNPKKVIFVFEKTPNFNSLIERYWKDELNVNARTYFDNIRSLKNRIYSS